MIKEKNIYVVTVEYNLNLEEYNKQSIIIHNTVYKHIYKKYIRLHIYAEIFIGE